MKSKKKFESQIVDLVDRLPPMPKNIDSLLRSAGEDRQHEEELIELAEQDPGLCADLLHQANTIESSHRHWTKKRADQKKAGSKKLKN